MKKLYKNAGIRIRFLREERHYTREYLAEMADISPKFLYEIESGQKGFSADTLYRLAEALETNADYILYGEYRGKIDNELGRIFNTFDDDKKRLVVKIMDLICEFAEE